MSANHPSRLLPPSPARPARTAQWRGASKTDDNAEDDNETDNLDRFHDNIAPPVAKTGIARMTGNSLAALTQRAQSSLAVPRGVTTFDLASQAAAEATHEVIALVGRRLVTNWANVQRFQAGIDATAPTIVVSFLGDTAVGKSTLIAALMGGGDDAPFVQRASSQTASTTCNVNLYPCRSLGGGLVVNLLDFEGEGGSASPVMLTDGTARPFARGGVTSSVAGTDYVARMARHLGVDVDAREVTPTGTLLAALCSTPWRNTCGLQPARFTHCHAPN